MLGKVGTAVVAATVGQLHGAVGTVGVAGNADAVGNAETAPVKAEGSGRPGTEAAKVEGSGKAAGTSTGTTSLILFKKPNYAWL